MKLFQFFLRKTIEAACPPQHTEDIPAQVEQRISVGSKWVLKRDGDPWPNRYPPAEILDVKSGWVRYSMGPRHMSMFPDNRREIGDFLRIYEPF